MIYSTGRKSFACNSTNTKATSKSRKGYRVAKNSMYILLISSMWRERHNYRGGERKKERIKAPYGVQSEKNVLVGSGREGKGNMKNV